MVMGLTVATTTIAADIVINEIDYDQAGTDAAEFVELKNTSGGGINLQTYTLELVNGTGGGATVYDTIALPDVVLAAGDYFVVCANAATVANCDLDDGPNTNFVQNGAPDAVGLRNNGALVDAVSYEGNAGAPYTEGTGTGLVDDPSITDSGIARFPDGTDTDQNNIDFAPCGITPGAANLSCDDNPPQVTSTTPTDGAIDVALNSDITITFSEAVTAPDAAFSISCSISNAVAFAASSGDSTTFTLNPDADFVAEQCTVTVAAAQVADQDGTPQNMAGDFEFSFATEGFVPPLGDIVINEIIQNPSAVSDTNGEWFELFNRTDAPIDINGWTIEDNDSDDFVIDNSGPLNVPAGGYVVLGRNADFGSNGGVNVDYEYSGMFLSNGSDELVVRDGSLAEIDRVEWDNGATFPDPNGASMSLISPVLDNNVGANWCTGTTPYGDGDRGTPGAANDCIDMIINEIIQNPSAVSDGNGEWFELFNPTSAELDINGWTIKDDGSNSHVIDNSGPLNVPAGGFVVLGRNADSVINGGVSLDYAYGSAFTLANGDDEVILLDLALN